MPTNRYFNVPTVTFTPQGGSATTLTGIKSANFDEGVAIAKESGDGDIFPTVSVNEFNDPTITIETLDAFVLSATLAGARGALVVTVADAYNGVTTSGGGKKYTMSGAHIQGRTASHGHRQFSRQSLVFGSVSADGLTHPVAVSAL